MFENLANTQTLDQALSTGGLATIQNCQTTSLSNLSNLGTGLSNLGSLCDNVNYSYPSYSYTTYVDKTDKAIKIIKNLMDEKIIDIKSISRFLELVDKIKAEL